MGIGVSRTRADFSCRESSFISPSERTKESDATRKQVPTNGDSSTKLPLKNQEKVPLPSAPQGYAASFSNSTVRWNVDEQYKKRHSIKSSSNAQQTVSKDTTAEVRFEALPSFEEIGESVSNTRQTVKNQDADLRSLVKRVKNNDLAVPIAAHTLLREATLRDMQKTMRAYQKFEALFNDKAGVNHPPVLHMYNSVKQMLGGHFHGESWQLEKNWSEQDYKYFGRAENIPKKFWEAIANPSAQKLSDAALTCSNLSVNLDPFFVEQSTKLISGLPKDRKEAFDALNRTFWNGTYPGKKWEVIKNPQAFIAETYNAVSLALGYTGTHISILKQQMAWRPGLQTDENQQQIQTTDDAYKNACEVMDGVYLALEKETGFGKMRRIFSFGDSSSISLSARRNAGEPSTAEPSQTLSVRLAAPLNGPVIDPDTGALNKENFQQAISSLIRLLPELSAASDFSQIECKDNLDNALEALVELVRDDRQSSPDKLGLKIRGGLDQAAGLARKLTANLEGSQSETDLAMIYSCIGALLFELKRIHLTAAAPDGMKAYVDKEIQNMEAHVPGINKRLPGSQIVTSTALSATHDVGIPFTKTKISVGGGLTADRTILCDDDRDCYMWALYGAYATGKGEAAGILGLSGKAAAKGSTTYIETKTMDQLIALMVDLDANRKNYKSLLGKGSAASEKRTVLNALDKSWKRFAQLIGMHYQSEAGKPDYLNEDKLAKGVNSTKIQLIAAAADKLTGNEHFSVLIKAAYPSIAKLVKSRLGHDQPLPDEPIGRTYPKSVFGGAGAVPVRKYNLEFGGSVSKSSTSGSGVEGFGTSSLTGSFEKFIVDLTDSMPAHALLAAGALGDMRQTLSLHRQIDRLLKDKASAKHRPEFHLYNSVSGALGEKKPGQYFSGEYTPTHLWLSKQSYISEQDRHYFGPYENIPEQFFGAIANPDTQKLSDAALICDGLSDLYTEFIERAHILKAIRDKYTPPAIINDLSERRSEAFDKINDVIWNDAYPGKKNEVIKNPKAFIAESYNAMSLVLGWVGTYISILKRQIAQRPELQTDESRQQIRMTDAAYKKVCGIMDKVYLPFKQKTIFDKSSLITRGIYEVYTAGANLGGGGGSALNLFQAAGVGLGQQDITEAFNVPNSAGQFSVSGMVNYQYAYRQNNPCRVGHFLSTTITLKGGAPFLGQAIKKEMLKALQKIFPGASVKDHERLTANWLRELKGLVFDHTNAINVIFKWRKAFDTKKFELQYMRVTSDTNNSFKVNIPIVHKGGVTTVGVSHGQLLTTNELELCGTDLGYLMLQHPPLKDMLSQEDADAAMALSELFEENPELKNRYFVRPDTITSVIDKHRLYTELSQDVAWKGRSEKSKKSNSMPNEFFRYYENEPFKRVAEVVNEVKHYAAGSTADKQDVDPFAAPPSLRETIETLALPADFDWKAAKKHIQRLPDAHARMEYFCSPQGRPVFDAFVKILDNILAVNNNGTLHTENGTGVGVSARLSDNYLSSSLNLR